MMDVSTSRFLMEIRHPNKHPRYELVFEVEVEFFQVLNYVLYERLKKLGTVNLQRVFEK